MEKGRAFGGFDWCVNFGGEVNVLVYSTNLTDDNSVIKIKKM